MMVQENVVVISAKLEAVQRAPGSGGVPATSSLRRFKITVLHREDAETEQRALAEHVKRGLGRGVNEKALSSMYFYDDAGSEIYQRITELEEYYPTACENEIFKTHKQRIVQTFRENLGGETINIVELGAGDGHKTRVLLHELLDAGVDFEYIPIDISRHAIIALLSAVEREFRDCPQFKCHGLIADNDQGLAWVRAHRSATRKNVVLFLGSSIGNYDLSEARLFLSAVRRHLRSGDQLLIGFDLKKDPEVLRLAYSDPYMVTAEFNFNLLRRINRELGANFDVAQFYHMANYNAVRGCMESWLISRCDQIVTILALGQEVKLQAYESIHTEVSFKYTLAEIRKMAAECGFDTVDEVQDSREYFVDAIWRASL